MLVLSANAPKTAEPRPPIPNANPKNNPETRPTFPGNNSCAYTNMAEKAEAIIKPINMLSTQVKNNETCGSNNVNGAAPSIENQITYFLPKRSPRGPPSMVPTATANKNAKRYNCDI